MKVLGVRDDGGAVLVFDLMHGALKNQRRIASDARQSDRI